MNANMKIACFVFCSPDQVLGREIQEVMVHVIDLGVGGHGGAGSKGPAAATASLVLGFTHLKIKY